MSSPTVSALNQQLISAGFQAASNLGTVNPIHVLGLIEQAELKIKGLELWRENIHSDACLLLSHIRRERLERALELERLTNEVNLLRERSAECERIALEALSDKENALKLYEIANIKAMAAEAKIGAAENRAYIAEEWLLKLQIILSNEF